MAEVSGGAIRLIDRDGDPLDDGNGKLNINATLEAATVNIGDVDILTVPAPLNLTGGGAESSALRVTLANDSTGVLSIDDNGGSLTIDGTVTANLGTTDNAVLDLIQANTLLSNSVIYAEDTAHSNGDKGILILGVHNESDTIFAPEDDYTPINIDRHGRIALSARIGLGANLVTIIHEEDSSHISTDKGIMPLAVRNDVPTFLGGSDGDYAPLQTSYLGGLYVDQIVHSSPDTFAMIDVDNSDEQLSATIGTFTDCTEIFLQADEDNSGYVMVGDSAVADNRGMKLNPGDTLILDIADTRTVYLWGSAADQNVRCMIHKRLT